MLQIGQNPSLDKPKLGNWKKTFMQFAGGNRDQRFGACVSGMDVRRRVIIREYQDFDSVETGDGRHVRCRQGLRMAGRRKRQG